MSHKSRPDPGFTCARCKAPVGGSSLPGTFGSFGRDSGPPVGAPAGISIGAPFGTRHRNHCPVCLWSRHLDDEPGDRASPCRSLMEPIAVEVRRDGEWAIVHRCTGCGVLRTNRIAGDDREMALLALALRPIANPAFPLDDWRVPP